MTTAKTVTLFHLTVLQLAYSYIQLDTTPCCVESAVPTDLK